MSETLACCHKCLENSEKRERKRDGGREKEGGRERNREGEREGRGKGERVRRERERVRERERDGERRAFIITLPHTSLPILSFLSSSHSSFHNLI